MAFIFCFLSPGRETLLAHLHESAIIVAVAPRIDNLYGFAPMATFGLPDLKFYYDLFYPALRATIHFTPKAAASLPGARGA